MTKLEYSLTILKINYFVLGGATLTTPFYYHYFVTPGIIPEEDINNYLTMANILPGAMSFYMSAYTGLYLYGRIGMILSLSVLIMPITLISIFIFSILNLIPFDLQLLIYISLPIMIIACADYLTKVFKSELDIKPKIVIFSSVLLLLISGLIGSIMLIISFIIIILFLSQRENNVKDNHN